MAAGGLQYKLSQKSRVRGAHQCQNTTGGQESVTSFVQTPSAESFCLCTLCHLSILWRFLEEQSQVGLGAGHLEANRRHAVYLIELTMWKGDWHS